MALERDPRDYYVVLNDDSMVVEFSPGTGINNLMTAARNAHIGSIPEEIPTEIINMQDNNGNTALHHGIGNFAIVLRLVKNGADININNNDGVTPLQMIYEISKTSKEYHQLLTVLFLETIPTDIVDYITRFLEPTDMVLLMNYSTKYYNLYYMNPNNQIWDNLTIITRLRMNIPEPKTKHKTKVVRTNKDIYFNMTLKEKLWNVQMMILATIGKDETVKKNSNIIIENELFKYKLGWSTEQINEMLYSSISVQNLFIFETLLFNFGADNHNSALYDILASLDATISEVTNEMIDILLEQKEIDLNKIYKSLLKNNSLTPQAINILIKYDLPRKSLKSMIKFLIPLVPIQTYKFK